jgi:predicted MFS family arabinose efflux permease
MWGMAADVWFGRKTIYLLCRMAGTTLLLTLALPAVYRSIPWIFAVSLLTVTFSSSGILDAYTLELLGETNKTMYGRYRMWCALSWGAGAVCMGWLTDRFGFEWNFILYGFMGILSCLMIAALVPQRTMVEEQEQEQGKIGDLICLFTRPRVVLFCLELILVGGAMATVERLLFLYLVDDLGASTFLCGLSVGVTVLLELPTFWCADWLLRWLGHDYLVAVSMLCFVVRTYGYTLLTPSTVTWVLALEIMHGITFACFWISVMDVTKILSRQVHGWNTTIPVLTNTIFQCVGGGLGSILGGWTMNKYGSKYMYHGISTIMLVALVLHVMGALVVRYCGSSHCKTFLPTKNEQDPDTTEHSSDPENEELIDKDGPFS